MTIHTPGRGLVAGALLLATLAGGCATTGVNQGDVNLISVEEEWELGRRLEGDLRGQLQLIETGAAVDYLNRVGRRIVEQTELADMPWEFHLVRDPAVNAFNIPGGHVYVHTGLLEAADTVAELTGVLAHEIAHGVARHGTEQLTRSYGLQLVAGLVLGENPPVYQEILAQIGGTGAMAKFSRDAEREADGLGVSYMARAGYDPEGMASLFEELLRRRQRTPSAVERFFATHPVTEERIDTVRAQAAEVGRPGLTRNDPEYQRIRERFA